MHCLRAWTRQICGVHALRLEPVRALRCLFPALATALIAFALMAAAAPAAPAQDMGDAGSEMAGPEEMPPPSGAPDESGRLAPIPRVPLRQPISGSMMVSPPYGNAPLRVGFFVLANDPENIGFLTYHWNFGDGTVSSLPPEMYIFHTYAAPGNYVCTLIVKTVDGRSKTLLQGVVVKPMAN